MAAVDRFYCTALTMYIHRNIGEFNSITTYPVKLSKSHSGSSLHQLSRYIPKIVCHLGGLEFDGALPPSSSSHTPFLGRAKGVAYRGGGGGGGAEGGGRGGVSAITAVVGRSGEKMDLTKVEYDMKSTDTA